MDIRETFGCERLIYGYFGGRETNYFARSLPPGRLQCFHHLRSPILAGGQILSTGLPKISFLSTKPQYLLS